MSNHLYLYIVLVFPENQHSDPRTVVRDTSSLQPYCDFEEDEPIEAAELDVVSSSPPEPSVTTGVPTTGPVPGAVKQPINRSSPQIGIRTAGEMLNAITELHRRGQAVADAERKHIVSTVT